LSFFSTGWAVLFSVVNFRLGVRGATVIDDNIGVGDDVGDLADRVDGCWTDDDKFEDSCVLFRPRVFKGSGVDADVVGVLLVKKLRNEVCFPECSSQNFAANLGRSILPLGSAFTPRSS